MEKRLTIAALLLAISFSLVGCGGSSRNSIQNEIAATETGAVVASMDSVSFGTAPQALMPEAKGSNIDPNEYKTNRKLIRTIDVRYKLKENQLLSDAVAEIAKETSKYSAYIESNYTSYDYDSYANLTIRIPGDKTDALLSALSSSYDIASINDRTEDVTLHYTDIESRLKVKRETRDKYLEYLDRAETIEDVMNVEDKLNSVIADIESAESQLRVLDNQINYTTINVTLESYDDPYRETLSERFRDTFGDFGYNIGTELIDGLEWFIGAIIWLIFILPIVFIVIRVLKFAFKGRRKKEEKRKSFNLNNPLTKNKKVEEKPVTEPEKNTPNKQEKI